MIREIKEYLNYQEIDVTDEQMQIIFEEVKNIAQSRAVDGMAYMSPTECYKIAINLLGIEEKEPPNQMPVLNIEPKGEVKKVKPKIIKGEVKKQSKQEEEKVNEILLFDLGE